MSLYHGCNYSGCLFFLSPRLNNHSLWLCSLPEQSINITGFLGITKCTHEAAATRQRFTCNLSARSILPSQTGRRSLVKKNPPKKPTHTPTHPTSVLHQNRNSLAWNINLPRKRHRESETSSNLMQEKTAIWLGCVNLKRGEERDLSLSLFLHLSFLSSPAKRRPLMCSSA